MILVLTMYVRDVTTKNGRPPSCLSKRDSTAGYRSDVVVLLEEPRTVPRGQPAGRIIPSFLLVRTALAYRDDCPDSFDAFWFSFGIKTAMPHT